MGNLLAFRVRKLVAQSNCPACGSAIISGGGGVAFAISQFACSSEFMISNDEIVVSKHCPAASQVAAGHLNDEAAEEAAEAGLA